MPTTGAVPPAPLFQQGLLRLLRPGAVFQRGDDLRQIPQALGAVGDFQRLEFLRRALARSWSQRCTMSLIMPCRPIFWPSSTE
jgi:hypothetical protein